MQMLLCLRLVFQNFRYAKICPFSKQVSSINLHRMGTTDLVLPTGLLFYYFARRYIDVKIFQGQSTDYETWLPVLAMHSRNVPSQCDVELGNHFPLP
jgi:hypothetical protein